MIIVTHCADQHADDNEREQGNQSKAERNSEFLGCYGEHKIGMAFRKKAFHRAFTRTFAEPSATHEAFGCDVNIERIARSGIKEALNTARHVRHRVVRAEKPDPGEASNSGDP